MGTRRPGSRKTAGKVAYWGPFCPGRRPVARRPVHTLPHLGAKVNRMIVIGRCPLGSPEERGRHSAGQEGDTTLLLPAEFVRKMAARKPKAPAPAGKPGEKPATRPAGPDGPPAPRPEEGDPSAD